MSMLALNDFNRSDLGEEGSEKMADFEESAMGHLNELYAKALQYTKNEKDAEDLVQETLVKAYSNWDRFEKGTNCRAWLFTILRNTFINRYRRKKREREILNSDDTTPVEHNFFNREGTDYYESPERETMDPAERDARILARLREVMHHAWDNAPFYRRKWEDAGVHPDHVQSLEDFEDKVPVITKQDLRDAQAAAPPFGDYLCIPEGEIHHIHGTSGTTGRPTAFGIGRRDWKTIANNQARVMWAMGLRPGDMVFIASVFSLYMGSWGTLAGAERLGCQCFPFGAGAPAGPESPRVAFAGLPASARVRAPCDLLPWIAPAAKPALSSALRQPLMAHLTWSRSWQVSSSRTSVPPSIRPWAAVA